MGIDIQGKGPQARGQERQKVLDIRHSLGQRQVEQHGPRRCHKGRGRLQLGRLRSRCRQSGVQRLQGKAGLLDAPQGQVGIGVEQAGGQPRPHVGTGEVGLRLQRRLFRLTAEVVVLRQGDVPLGPRLHGLHRLPAVPREKGGVHQRHEDPAAQRPAGRRLCRSGRLLAPDPAGASGLLGVGGDGPGFSELLRSGDPPLDAQLLYGPGRETPFFSGLPHGERFHDFASPDKRFLISIICAMAHGCKRCGGPFSRAPARATLFVPVTPNQTHTVTHIAER